MFKGVSGHALCPLFWSGLMDVGLDIIWIVSTETLLASSRVSGGVCLWASGKDRMCPRDGDIIICMGRVPHAWSQEKYLEMPRSLIGVGLWLGSFTRLVLRFAPAGLCWG